jgi:hypothetical protein
MAEIIKLPSSSPEPSMSGTFALYETPDGGYHLAFRPRGENEDRHIQIPGFMVKMAWQMQDGDGPASLLKSMIRRKKA